MSSRGWSRGLLTWTVFMAGPAWGNGFGLDVPGCSEDLSHHRPCFKCVAWRSQCVPDNPPPEPRLHDVDEAPPPPPEVIEHDCAPEPPLGYMSTSWEGGGRDESAPANMPVPCLGVRDDGVEVAGTCRWHGGDGDAHDLQSCVQEGERCTSHEEGGPGRCEVLGCRVYTDGCQVLASSSFTTLLGFALLGLAWTRNGRRKRP